MTQPPDDGLIHPGQRYQPDPTPRIRVKISDVAWGVFWGLFAWSVFAFFGLLFLGAL